MIKIFTKCSLKDTSYCKRSFVLNISLAMSNISGVWRGPDKWLIPMIFSCISRDLIIAKFEAYGFHIDVLNYFYSTFCKPLQAILMITAQKMKFSIKDFFSKCYQIRWKLQIWSHLLKKSLMENLIFCAMDTVIYTVNIKESATSAPQTFSSLLFGCFTNNLMNAESDKKHLIRSCTEANTAIINGLSISLGTTID